MKPVLIAKNSQEAFGASWNFSFSHWLNLMNFDISFDIFQSPTTAMATASPSYMLAMASPELMYAQMPPYQPAELTDATVLESAGVEVMAHPFAL